MGPEVKEGEGHAMHDLVSRLFPICRSITGDGVRETLRILAEQVPLAMREVPTGTKVFDWKVPREWNIRDAYISDTAGNRVLDFNKSNLHVVGYSVPVSAELSLSDLQQHLHSIPEQPEAVPYVTSYYKDQWGFCLSQKARDALVDGTYRVFIESELTGGSLTYGELVIPGRVKKEVFLSTYVCHPSLANDNLSGPVVATFLAKWVAREPRRYTYRFVFIPETIGALTYLSKHLEHLQSAVIAGFNVTCVGDDRTHSYLPSRHGNTIADRAALAALRSLDAEFVEFSFLDRGSDERQYCAPGIDLPVVSLLRSKYGAYSEYHTSLDNLSLVTPSGLYGGYEAIRRALERIENGVRYRTTTLGEPQLGRRGLYPHLSTKATGERVRTMMNILAYADGSYDLEDLCEVIGAPLEEVSSMAGRLEREGLLKREE